MKSVTNNKGVVLEYDEKFLDKIREVLNKKNDEEITKEEMFAFFHAVYDNALNKKKYIVE